MWAKGRLWLSGKRGEPVVPPGLTLSFNGGVVTVDPCTALNALQQLAGVNLFSLGLQFGKRQSLLHGVSSFLFLNHLTQVLLQNVSFIDLVIWKL
jgi:hypothetical protein